MALADTILERCRGTIWKLDFWTHHIQLHIFTMSNHDRQILEPRVHAAYVLFWSQCYSTSSKGKLCPFPQCRTSSRLTLYRNAADLWCSGRFLCHSPFEESSHVPPGTHHNTHIISNRGQEAHDQQVCRSLSRASIALVECLPFREKLQYISPSWWEHVTSSQKVIICLPFDV